MPRFAPVTSTLLPSSVVCLVLTFISFTGNGWAAAPLVIRSIGEIHRPMARVHWAGAREPTTRYAAGPRRLPTATGPCQRPIEQPMRRPISLVALSPSSSKVKPPTGSWAGFPADLLIELPSGGGRGVRARLEAGLRCAIQQERLSGGAVLPPSRVLAADLGTARSVVVEAYRNLAAAGYLETRRGGWTRVRPRQAVAPANDSGSETH